LDRGGIRHCIAWCHDLSWTSPNSKSKVHPGYPWDFLRTYRPDVTYVTVSQARQNELEYLFQCPPENIRVIYNGVDPAGLLDLPGKVSSLAEQLNLWGSDMILLMPVRVTQAKNIEYAEKIIAALNWRGFRPQLIVTGPPDPHDPENMRYYQSLLELRRRLQVEQEVCFVYEQGTEPGKHFLLTNTELGGLYRVSDAVLMPSHREGFGIPVLEAGLAGIPVIATHIPAADEIGNKDILMFSTDAKPAETADSILKFLENSPIFRLRRRIRQNYTWKAIFTRDILPLLVGE
jgi:mannosylglucosylglycerate synthase